MPYGDLGFLAPSAGSYRAPGAAVSAARIEGFKRSNYLAQMDQFNAKLVEMKREFDITAQYKEDVLSFEQKQADRTYGLAERQYSLSEELGRGKLQLGQATLAEGKRAEQARLGFSYKQLDQNKSLDEQKMQLQRELGMSELEARKWIANLQASTARAGFASDQSIASGNRNAQLQIASLDSATKYGIAGMQMNLGQQELALKQQQLDYQHSFDQQAAQIMAQEPKGAATDLSSLLTQLGMSGSSGGALSPTNDPYFSFSAEEPDWMALAPRSGGPAY